jgi:hypothetical protein
VVLRHNLQLLQVNVSQLHDRSTRHGVHVEESNASCPLKRSCGNLVPQWVVRPQMQRSRVLGFGYRCGFGLLGGAEGPEERGGASEESPSNHCLLV